ncbi:MAG TPA: ZIP family metal transporter, partial [Pirellulaceae bacterium]
IVGSSLLGGWLPSRLRMSHTAMQCTISFVGGFMLGIGLLHLLPHGIAQAQSVDIVLRSALVGLLFTFFLIRLFHFHQHWVEIPDDEAHTAGTSEGHHRHHHGPEGCSHDVTMGGIHELGWTGVALGLAVHTLMDGIALGAAVMADSQRSPDSRLYGVGVFLAIILHKPLDAFSITSLMKASGWNDTMRHAASIGFATMCPMGALLFCLGTTQFDVDQARILGATLGFSTGVFLCISLGDLLPELQFHRHDRVKLSAAMLLGVGLSYAMGYLEPANAHALHGHPPATTSATENR